MSVQVCGASMAGYTSLFSSTLAVITQRAKSSNLHVHERERERERRGWSSVKADEIPQTAQTHLTNILLVCLDPAWDLETAKHGNIHTKYSMWGLNPRPMAHKTIALTTELIELVAPAGEQSPHFSVAAARWETIVWPRIGDKAHDRWGH